MASTDVECTAIDDYDFAELSLLSTSTANDQLGSEFEKIRSARQAVEDFISENEDDEDLGELIDARSSLTVDKPVVPQVQDPASALFFSVTTDEDAEVQGEFIKERPGALRFKLKFLDFIIEQKQPADESSPQELHVYAEAREPNVEWRFMVQLRVLTSQVNYPLRVVDYDVFEFNTRSRPLILVNKATNLNHIRIEMRYVQQFYEKLPNFDIDLHGADVLLDFNDGLLPMRAHSALLALYSAKIAKMIEKYDTPEFIATGGTPVLMMTECDRSEFLEVLFHMYSTNRPLWADFRRLTKGAVAYQVLPILEKLITHMLDFDMPVMAKLHEALKLGLDDAARELAFMAEKLGIWTYVIGTGMDPKKEFGEEAYRNLICPSIVLAKRSPRHVRIRQVNELPYNLTNPTPLEKAFAVPLVVSGKTYYVNKGILKLYNDSEFGRGNNGELYPRITVELKKYLEAHDMPLQIVIEVMLNFMNPMQRHVRIEFVRPIIILAAEHKMPRLLREMEKILVDEPPMTPELLLNHFELGAKYNFANLTGQSLLRIEANYLSVAHRMIDLPAFKTLSSDLQALIMDRISSGWAQTSWRLANSVPTRKIRRFVNEDDGGPSNHDADLATFNDINSMCAFGEPQDVRDFEETAVSPVRSRH
uniref:U-box domain-containing protein n=1 Tax=Panagrellus redivivus TaxID=6233 RepID=A0A7E4VNK6_PANRE